MKRILIFLLATSHYAAAEDRCSDILDHGIYDTTYSGELSSLQNATRAKLCTSTSSEAFQVYSKIYRNYEAQCIEEGGEISSSGSYMEIFSASGDGEYHYQKCSISKRDNSNFSRSFSRYKSAYCSESSSTYSSRYQNIILTKILNEEAVKAWSSCMTSRYRDQLIVVPRLLGDYLDLQIQVKASESTISRTNILNFSIEALSNLRLINTQTPDILPLIGDGINLSLELIDPFKNGLISISAKINNEQITLQLSESVFVPKKKYQLSSASLHFLPRPETPITHGVLGEVSCPGSRIGAIQVIHSGAVNGLKLYCEESDPKPLIGYPDSGNASDPYESTYFRCPPNYHFAGIKTRTGHWTDTAWLICRNASGDKYYSDLFGGTAGGPNITDNICPEGKRMIGIHAYHWHPKIGTMAPICL